MEGLGARSRYSGANGRGPFEKMTQPTDAVGLLVAGLHLRISGAGSETLLLLEGVHLLGLALGLANGGLTEGVAGIELGLERSHVVLLDIRAIVREGRTGMGAGDLRFCDPEMCNWIASGVYELAPRRPTTYLKEEES